MTKKTLAKCYVISGIILIIIAFGSIVNIINNQNNYNKNVSSHVILAFDG
ncbi:MAG: hypothetical protein V2B14_06640 [bacterium]